MTVATVVGETLHLLPERAAFWERTRTLLVADAHIGKAAAFRAAGVPVPHGTTGGTLERLAAAVERTNSNRIVFLGDLLHAREGRAPATLRALATWRERYVSTEMVLVRGNHDKRAGDPPPELGFRCVDGALVEPPFVFTHRPAASDDGYVICGHLHPAARLAGGGRDFVRLPCFWFGPDLAVLPAFGEFTGLAVVNPAVGDRVWVIADGLVIAAEPAATPS
jgi:DNA ligase-associated metallophosphoesterase